MQDGDRKRVDYTVDPILKTCSVELNGTFDHMWFDSSGQMKFEDTDVEYTVNGVPVEPENVQKRLREIAYGKESR